VRLRNSVLQDMGERIANETIDLCSTAGPFHSMRNDNRRDENQTGCATPICRQSRIPNRTCSSSYRSLALPVVGLCVFALFCGCGGNSMKGSVAATANPQVAIYTVTPEQPGEVTIFFGTTTSYGFQTWTRKTQTGGAPVSIYVAGMKANTLYHMQALEKHGDGTTVKDADRTFKTGSYPASSLPNITTTTSPGQTQQSGIEMLNTIESTVQISAADLSGNIIWAI
jgi:hypothetical protein